MDSESKDTVQKKKKKRHKAEDAGPDGLADRSGESADTKGRTRGERQMRRRRGAGSEEGRARERRREGLLSEAALAVRGSHIQRPTCFPVAPVTARSQPGC